jgi:hypothetical protein
MNVQARRDDVPVRAAATLGTMPESYSRSRSSRRSTPRVPLSDIADAVREAMTREHEQLNRLRAKLAETTRSADAASSVDGAWLQEETEAAREQVFRLESLLRRLEPTPEPPTPAEFDPRALLLRGGAELGDSIQVLLSDPESGRQYLLSEGDVVHGYTVALIERTEQGLLLIRLESEDDVVELIESGL